MSKPFRTHPGDRAAIIWLSVISVLTHFRWLFTFQNFTSGDWWYIGIQRYLDFRHFSPIWVTEGLGNTSAVPPFYFIRFLEGLTTYVGGNFALNEKVFFFVPITFGASLGTYLFLRQYFKPFLAFVGSIIFAFNTAMLFNYAGALTIGTAYALTPLALYLFRQYLRHPKDRRLLIGTALSWAVMASYEQRITLLVIALSGGLFLFNCLVAGSAWHYARGRIWPLTKIFVLLFALHAFWLLPYVVNARSGVTFSDLLSQRLFESFSDVQNALTLFHPFWTGERPATFILQIIPLYAWMLPILAFGGLLIRTKRNMIREHKEVAYWAFVALIGVFMVKQVNEPFVGTYPWIFTHVPGFSAFREASKFYLLVAIAYAVLVPYTLAVLKQFADEHTKPKQIWIGRIAFGAASAMILLLFGLNMKPLVTGELRTLYIPRHMPADYAKLEQFVGKQSEYFRLLWLPTNSRWGVQSNQHPSVRAIQVEQGGWLSQLGGLKGGELTQTTQRDKVTRLLAQNSSDTFMDRASVKYVVVPLRDSANEDDFFRYYGDDRNYYVQQLNATKYLRRIDIGTSNLAVYENLNYQPHISTFTDLQRLDIAKGVDPRHLFQFVTKELGQAFNFETSDKKTAKQTVGPKTRVLDPFQDVEADNLTSTGLQQLVGAMDQPMLHVDQSSQLLRYEVKDRVFAVYGRSDTSQLSIDDQPLAAAQPEQILAKTPLQPGTEYFLSLGEELITLPTTDSNLELGHITQPLRLFAAGPNTLKNYSFEARLWQPQVSDCNHYDAKPLIGMQQRPSDATKGKVSLELKADRHTACTDSPPTEITTPQMLVSFDYRVWGGRTAGYELIFDDAQKTRVKEDIPTQRQTWQTLQRVINVPTGARQVTVRLMGYPDYRLKEHAATLYDNVLVRPLAQRAAIQPAKPAYTPTPLPQNQSFNVGYQTVDATSTNIVRNSTFDNGLWRDKVTDCDAYDQKPVIGMRTTQHGTGKALQLSAIRHAACTSQDNIPVSGTKTYLFNFDYQSPNAQAAHYLLEFNDPRHTVREGRVPITGADWQTYTQQLRAPLGATKLKITFFAYSNSSGVKEFVNNYDNVSLRPMPPAANRFYITDAATTKLAHPASVNFTNASATAKMVRVRGASTPFYLAMSESYNPRWQLRLDNQRGLARYTPWASATAVAENKHVKLNDFQNGWYVDPALLCKQNSSACQKNADQSYDLNLVVEFASQRWFYVGTVISGLTLLSCTGYVGYTVLRRKPRHWSL